MLREERATGASYDPAKDQLVVEVGAAGTSKTSQKELNLLLDARGHLVGIDLGGDGAARWVVMLGNHEDVAEQRSGRGEVAEQPGGAPAAITILGARALVRVDERNPYL